MRLMNTQDGINVTLTGLLVLGVVETYAQNRSDHCSARAGITTVLKNPPPPAKSPPPLPINKVPDTSWMSVDIIGGRIKERPFWDM